ncbi:binding-protein-dependent transport systems inner membrane component [Xylanimonas cellulosilytica DSM 15894]|uniref:Binding-protein-dependent transport systems inner membrane component n=1 Tax=Xylanimonas cellulosilytica (strain DSM 15894 / JCM 12276 / CECT 5975 / KCTC 9989 / LMG 20990 / NBRC 107835 / XIL07) TaxID=446471 RepID=D1BUC1_XYLCX|nr:carbohydrate ABC transporter permease [Xylanimonas cellulosilytica]ACZ31134.1 binding-protein-dependent transport systems inner membrane component [Xylanimonas cellulosilytica DSM 15894]
MTTVTAPVDRTLHRGFSSIRPREIVIRYALLVLVLVLMVGPFLWQLSTSLKGPADDIYSTTPQLIPGDPTFANFVEAATKIPILQFALNSVLVAVLVVGGNVLGATLAGYALARLRFRGRAVVLGAILGTMLLPAESTIVAQYLTVRSMGLSDNLLGVALPGMVGMINILLMRAAFTAVPKELDEAALVDGANVWQRFWRIGVPNVRGMIAVVSVFAFIAAWDDFLWPLIVLTTPDRFTLTVGLQYLSGAFSSNPRVVAAGTMIAFIPIVIFFMVLQKQFFKGVDAGAIKG